VADHPHGGQGGWFGYRMTEKKKKKIEDRFWPLGGLGVAGPPPWPMGWFSHLMGKPLKNILRVWPLGVVRPPLRAKTHQFFIFYFYFCHGVAAPFFFLFFIETVSF
jgi:hypothetical protein